MKRLLIIIAFLISVTCSAQTGEVVLPKDSITGKFTFTDVVKVDSTHANQLYSKARMFIAEAFKSAKDVIQLDDKDNSTLIAKGATTWYTKALGSPITIGYIHFLLKIECKDGRYRYTFTDYSFDGSGVSAWGVSPAENPKGTQKNINYFYQQIQDFTTSMIADLKLAMSTPLASKSDW